VVDGRPGTRLPAAARTRRRPGGRRQAEQSAATRTEEQAHAGKTQAPRDQIDL